MTALPFRVERMSEGCKERLLERLQQDNAALRRRVALLETACRVAGEELRAEQARTRQAVALVELEREA